MSTAFLGALAAARLPVVMEIKRRDGHDRDLLGGRSLSAIVSAYEAAGAPCLSVVTGRWFGGRAEVLRDVARLTDLPILQKDFIATERQIAEARGLGASAVLLTAGILAPTRLRRLTEAALAAGLTPFVEVASDIELADVVHGEDCVVAVNNRDIGTRERSLADLRRSRALLAPVLATGTRCPVSASGLDDPAAASGMIAAGFRGVLVGTGLLQAASPLEWVEAFAGSLGAAR
jgi:indole-3-glycerol phosphate synthase